MDPQDTNNNNNTIEVLKRDLGDIFERYRSIIQKQSQSLQVSSNIQDAMRLLVSQLTADFLYTQDERKPHLPLVSKIIETGPRGGLYYKTKEGKIIWLKKRQREKCQQNILGGAQGTCQDKSFKKWDH